MRLVVLVILKQGQKIKVKVTSKTKKHYDSLGYTTKIFDYIEVKAEHLSKGSHEKVCVICDNCYNEFYRAYKDYLRYHIKDPRDFCKKCSEIKIKETCLKKYGTENVNSLPEIREKIKTTSLERYGVENYSSTEECKEKVKNTLISKYGTTGIMSLPEIKEKVRITSLEKYGVEHPRKSEIVKNKAKSTCIMKYGVENPLQNSEVAEKSRKTNLKKYGVENVFQNEKIKGKIKDTIKRKYGVEYISQSEEIKKKCIQTSLKHYGVKYPMQNKEVREKAKATNLKKYGYEELGSCPEIIEKRIKTLCNSGKQKTSKQQLKLYNLLKEQYNDVKLNYPFGRLSLDIALFIENIKIDIEYDGWYWHQDQNKDRRRDYFLKGNDWKILRIKSGRSIPNIHLINEKILELLNGKNYTQIVLDDWKEVESV